MKQGIGALYFIAGLILSGLPVWAGDTVNALTDINQVVQEATTPAQAPCPGSDRAPSTSPLGDSMRKWSDAGFKNPTEESWGPSVLYLSGSPTTSKFTHQIVLTTVLFRNSGWTKEEVEARFRRLAEVYSQCGIKVSKVNFVESDAPNGWVDINYSGEHRDQQIAQATPVTDRPIFYFVRSDQEGQLAYSWHPMHKGVAKSLMDTAWITSSVKEAEKSYYDRSYCVEAHELGHILEDADHLMDGTRNFLAGRADLVNDKINPNQCEQMKKHSAVHPL